jgi:hypothetical protein
MIDTDVCRQCPHPEEKMPLNPRKTTWGSILVLGSLWGLSEAALGMYLRQCASTVSGSLMTGAALFFLAGAWTIAPRVQTVAGMVVLASFFKLFDAMLLGLPVLHGAIANPIFAIATEGAAFLLLVSIVRRDLAAKAVGQGLTGGLTALLAVNAFPLVKFATGIAACKVAGTSIPLSIYYAPIAIALSMLTVPAGFRVGARVKAIELRLAPPGAARVPWAATAAFVLCLAALTLLRLI